MAASIITRINFFVDILNNLVTIDSIVFGWDKKKIFDGLSLTIPKGKITAVMGPSGTGKTTLLKIIGGQLKPESGKVEFLGEDIHKMSNKRLYQARKKMGMLFQTGALLSDLTVYDNVAFPLREHTNLPESMIKDLVLMKLNSVGLRGAHNLMPSELSGGMSRRIAIARAIALEPMFVMYDEPFTGQDPISMGVLVKLIKEINDYLGLTSVLVSHDVEEASSIADYICIISNGKLVDSGTNDELLNSNNEWVRQFMYGLPDGPVPFHITAPDYKQDLLG